MYLIHLFSFHNQEKQKRYGVSKANIMDCNLYDNFLYELWNGPIIYDVLIRAWFLLNNVF
jgi:hypothetical protein